MRLKFLLILIYTATSFSIAFGDCVEGDCKNGKGKFIFVNKAIYEGEFKDSKMTGKGVYTDPKEINTK
jgi:hypothetical protein